MNINGDHSKGAKDLMKNAVDVYMTQGTREALGLRGHRLHDIIKDRPFKVGRFLVKAFSVVHDAQDPVGYLIKSGPDLLLFVMDSMFVEWRFPGLTMIAMEVNHDEDLLDDNVRAGIVPRAIRPRVRLNHQSIRTFKKFLMANDLSKVREVHMIHISETNGDPDQFVKEVRVITGARVYAH